MEVGEWVWLLSEDGVQQNMRPYQIRALIKGLTNDAMPVCGDTDQLAAGAVCARRPPSDGASSPLYRLWRRGGMG